MRRGACAGPLRPAYGIGFERLLSQGPVFYALGVCFSRGVENAVARSAQEDEEELKISRWNYGGMAKKVYRDGLLRDIYPWNFLTPFQLERMVDGLPLAKWIKSDAAHGHLTPIADDMLLWEVEESQRQKIHAKLDEAGAIFDWRNSVA